MVFLVCRGRESSRKVRGCCWRAQKCFSLYLVSGGAICEVDVTWVGRLNQLPRCSVGRAMNYQVSWLESGNALVGSIINNAHSPAWQPWCSQLFYTSLSIRANLFKYVYVFLYAPVNTSLLWSFRSFSTTVVDLDILQSVLRPAFSCSFIYSQNFLS